MISITDGFVIDIDQIAVFEAFEAGEDKLVLIVTINIAGGVARKDEVSDLSRHSVGAGDGKLGNPLEHSGIDFTDADTESDWHVDIEFWNNESRFGRDGLGDRRVDGFDTGSDRTAVWRDVGHNRCEDKAVVLKEKPGEDN